VSLLRASVALAVVLATSLATLARAQEGSSSAVPAARGRVAVVLLPRGAASPEIADSLTELLIAAVASRGDVEIVGKEEFQAALGRDDAGTLACIESDACLGRMGRELRVEELVAGTLHTSTDAPDAYRFELYRLDVASGSARGRIAREVEGGLSALLSALNGSVAELYVERVEPGAIVIDARPDEAALSLDDSPLERAPDGSHRRAFLVPGEHVLTGRAPGHVPLLRHVTVEPGTTLMLSVELAPRPSEIEISPLTWSLGGVAAACVTVGAVLGGSSQSFPSAELDMRESRAFFDARAGEALGANALFVTAGAALVATVVSLVLDLGANEDGTASARAMRGEVASW
jgi:hypothetical protein